MPMITETNTTLEPAYCSKGIGFPCNKKPNLYFSFQATAIFTVKGIFEGIVCLPLKRDTAIFLFNKMLIPL